MTWFNCRDVTVSREDASKVCMASHRSAYSSSVMVRAFPAGTQAVDGVDGGAQEPGDLLDAEPPQSVLTGRWFAVHVNLQVVNPSTLPTLVVSVQRSGHVGCGQRMGDRSGPACG